MPEAAGFENIDTPEAQTDTPVTLQFPRSDDVKNGTNDSVLTLIGDLEDATEHANVDVEANDDTEREVDLKQAA